MVTTAQAGQNPAYMSAPNLAHHSTISVVLWWALCFLQHWFRIITNLTHIPVFLVYTLKLKFSRLFS